MGRDPRFDVLFEPVEIGPVTAPNRFYQVPHCTGMGYRLPKSLAAMRETKAEGGWGVVCTEYCSIHPSSDEQPLTTASLWDEEDVRAHALMTEKVHRHGALAGVELWHGGSTSPNLATQEGSMGPMSRPAAGVLPVQSRAMDKRDIRDLRRWHVEAAKRAQRAGFDIVYVYATHGYLLAQFLSPYNQRTDEYGGPIENRMRFPMDVFAAVRKAWPSERPLAVRISATDWLGDRGFTPDDAVTVARALQSAGCDLIDVSSAGNSPESEPEYGRMYQVPFAERIKYEVGIPVMAVGAIQGPDHCNTILAAERADLCAMARPHLADPYLTLRASDQYDFADQPWPGQYWLGRRRKSP